MISTKKLVRMGRKWQNLAALRQKRITFPRASNRTTRGIDKGHFAIYISDVIRFLMPFGYLKNGIFQKLLKVATDEHGLQTDGPIRLPFESMCMNHMISLIERHLCKESTRTKSVN
ncbi:auxin-responsive protein SAUR68-like protein [Tanacetum coccineum]